MKFYKNDLKRDPKLQKKKSFMFPPNKQVKPQSTFYTVIFQNKFRLW